MAHVTVTAPDGSKVLDKDVSTSEARRIKKLVEADPTKNLENFSSVANWPAVFGKAAVQPELLTQFPDIKTAEKALAVGGALEKLQPEERERVLARLRLDNLKTRTTRLSGIADQAELQKIRHDIEVIDSQIGSLNSEQAILSELRAWLDAGLRLDRPHASAYHRLEDAIRAGALKVATKEGIKLGNALNYQAGAQSFVIEHDWAAAFKSAQDFDGGEVRLPYENCVFEFRVTGKHICCLLDATAEPERIVAVVETKSGGWVLLAHDFERVGDTLLPKAIGATDDDLRRLLYSQIRAVCISLEAEAATTEVVRAPHKLNRKRESLGRAPLLDYHVVRLAHRSRVAPLEDGGDTEKRTGPRLHFRRGHWRHYENSKTWIRWMLVGNPDLGFIDKHYRL